MCNFRYMGGSEFYGPGRESYIRHRCHARLYCNTFLSQAVALNLPKVGSLNRLFGVHTSKDYKARSIAKGGTASSTFCFNIFIPFAATRCFAEGPLQNN
jgi:hypothetical protein